MKPLSPLAIAISVALSASLSVSKASAEADQTEAAIERLEVKGEQTSGYLAEAQQSASKLDLTIKEIPQTITVITAEKLRDFGLNDLNGALENSATVNVEQVESDRTYYTSRGFAVNNFQIDGLGLPLINDNTHGRVDAALYERIEIVHGANGVMTGIGSPSATINLVRKRPTSATQGSVSATVGSWESYRLEGDFSGAINDAWRARAVVVADERGSYLDRYANESQVFYVVADYAPTASTLITLGHSETNSETDGNLWGALTLYYGDGTPTNFATSTNIAADWSEWNVRESRSFIDVETALNDYWNLRIAYNRVRTDEDSLLFYTYLADPAVGLDPQTGLGLIGYGSEYDLDDKQDTLDVYVNGRFEAWGQTHEVVVGANWARLDYTDTSLYDFHTGNGFPVMPAIPTWTGATPLPEFTDGAAGSVIDNTQRALYAQARLGITDALKVLVGGRYNEFTTDGFGYGVDNSRDEAEFIPYVGVTYTVNPEVMLFSSYTETFMAQNLRNENFERLPALTGKNTEVGVKADLFDGSALLSAAYFIVQQENLGVGAGDAINPATGIPEPIYRAVDGIESKGFELELAGELLPALVAGLQGNIALTSFELDGDRLVEDYTPEHLLRSSITYTPSTLEQLTVGATYLWQTDISRVQGVVGPSYANAGDTIITTQPAYGRLNLMANYRFNDALGLTFNVNNATDEKYLNSLLWAQGYYGAPRNFSVNLTYKF